MKPLLQALRAKLAESLEITVKQFTADVFLHYIFVGPEAPAKFEEQLGTYQVHGASATLVDTSAYCSDAAWLIFGTSVVQQASRLCSLVVLARDLVSKF